MQLALSSRLGGSVWLAIATGLLAASVLASAVALRPAPAQQPAQDIPSCIGQTMRTIGAEKADVPLLYQLDGFCYNARVAELQLEQEKIRRDNFVTQRFENIVLMFMVVAITLSGVLLAGLQLFASYRLAAGSRAPFDTGSEISYKPDAVVIKSSVVGVIILAISFAFFIAFVTYVYTLRDVGGMPTAAPAPAQISTGTLERAPGQ